MTSQKNFPKYWYSQAHHELCRRSLLGLILLVLMLSAACTAYTTPTATSTPKPTPTAVPTAEASYVRFYNLVAHTSYLAVEGPHKIDLGAVALGTVTDYYPAERLQEPFEILFSELDAFTSHGPFDITADIQPGHNTFAIKRVGGRVIVELLPGAPELSSEPSLAEIRLLVSPENIPCAKIGSARCPLVKYSVEADWQPLEAPIEGFRFEPGYVYEMLVFKFEDSRTRSVRYEANYMLRRTEVSSETVLPSALESP